MEKRSLYSLRHLSIGWRVVFLIELFSLTMCLLKLSAEDLKDQSLNRVTLLVYTAVGLAAPIMRYGEIWLLDLLDYIVWGLVLMVMRIKMKTEIGEGDFWVLSGLMLFLSAVQMWEAVLYSFFLILPVSGCLFLTEKNIKLCVPYLPALCGGVIMLAGKECLKWFL